MLKFDFQLLYGLIALGLFYKRLSWRGWFAVTLTVFAWIMWNWKR